MSPVARKPVFIAFGKQMKFDADRFQEFVALPDGVHFALGNEIRAVHRLHAVG